MINLYLFVVPIAFVLMLISLRGEGSTNELGQDIAFAAFVAVLWPFTFLVVVSYLVRK